MSRGTVKATLGLVVALVATLVARTTAAGAPDCHSRSGGAFVTFSVRGGGVDEMQDPSGYVDASPSSLRGATRAYTVTQWVTNGAFIDSAIQRAQGTLRRNAPMIPVFNKVLLGTDCDNQWSWHVDPHDIAGWVDVTTEVCDASPMYLEQNGKQWTRSPGRWCPWKVASVLKVDDRRSPGSRSEKPLPAGIPPAVEAPGNMSSAAIGDGNGTEATMPSAIGGGNGTEATMPLASQPEPAGVAEGASP